MKIRTQLIAGIVIFALLLVIISGFIFSTNRQLDKLMVQEDLANSIALEVGELGFLTNDYILYREPQLEERWNAKYHAIADDIGQLDSDQAEQQVIARNLASNLRNTKSVFDEISAGNVPAGGGGTGFVQISWSRMAVQNQGMIFDAGRLTHLLREEETALRSERLLFIIALMGTFVAFLLTSYFLFYRRTLLSIRRLQNGAAMVGSGDFSLTIDAGSDDEIGDLAHSFDRMIAELRKVTASKADLEREIAGRKKAEEHLIRKNEDLNAANEELTATQEELHQNVEELTQAEKTLRESEEKFHVLFTRMVEGSALHELVYNATGDPVDYRILDINPAFERILGLKREDVIGKTSTCAYGVDAPPYFEIYRRVAETGRAEEFEVFFAPMKKHFTISAYSPEPGKFATIFTDITERRRAEERVKNLLEEVRQEKDRLSSLINSISDEVWFADTGKHFTLANPAALREFGLGLDRVDVEKFAAGLEVYLPDGNPRPAGEAPPLRALEGEEVRNFEEMVRTPGKGQVRYRQVSSNPVRDPSGNIIGSVSVVRDITDLKKAEGELIRKNIDLNALNEELTATQEELRQNVDDMSRSEVILRQNESQLKEALAEKEVLLAEIHHRVKNNLTAFISLLSLEGSVEETPAGRELKKDLQNRARSMALIHETLYRTNQFSEVDMDAYLKPLVDQVISSYGSPQSIRTTVEAKGVTLDLARATPAGLIVNELVTNSLKHAFPKEAIACRTDPCTIGIRLTREDGSYCLRVYDNGVGMPSGFDPRTAKSLGLKLVNFLAKHQMRAKVEVKITEGTEFVFRFKEQNPGA